MIALAERTPLYVPGLHTFEENGITYAVDAEAPNWIAVERPGAELLDTLAARRPDASPWTFGGLVARHAADRQLEAGKAWLHVHAFAAALARAGMLFDSPPAHGPYPKHAALVEPEGLREL